MSSQPALFDCLEAVASAVLVIRDGGIVWANSAALALTSFDHVSLTSKTLRDLIAPGWDERLSTGGEIQIVTPSGDSLPVGFDLRPASIDGQPIEIATLTDLRANRPSASAQISHESTYRRTIESSLDGFYLLKCRYDAAGQIVDFIYEDVNAQGERLSGSRHRLIGRGLRELFPESIVSVYWDKYIRVFQSGEILDEEYEVTTLDGVLHWFHHQVVPTEDGVAIFTRDITERKRIEVALRESERGYQALLNQSNDCISLLDMDGCYLLVNTQLAARLGYMPEEMIGRRVTDMIAPGEVGQYREIIRAVKAGVHVPLFERVYRRKDGTEFLGEVSITLVLDTAGNPVYIQSIMRDISWRKEAEQALRESEERYRIISELISDYAYSFRVEPDGTPVSEWITDSFTRMTGYTPEELDTRGRYALYYPGEETRVDADMRRVLAGEAGSAEYRIVTKSGEIRWVNIYRKPVWDEAHQRVVRMYGVAQDITARKQSEDELRRSEEQYRLIAENATDMISRTTSDDVRIYVSPACRTLLGYEPEELVGPNSPALVHPDDVATMEAAWRAIEQTDKAVTFNCRMRQKNGDYRWFEVTGKAIQDSDTRALKEYLALSRDISSRLQMETMLKEQERLRFELQKEQELNEVKSNLMRTISHEFRTPLTLIMTSTDFLDTYIDRLDPPRRQDRLQAIRIQVKRLSDMLDDISFVVQGTLHHMTAHPSTMNLESYCRDIVEEIQATIGQRHQLSFQPDGKLVNGWADKALFMRILTNLLSNAIKYSPDNSVITVGLRRSGSDALLEVSDRGIGIPPDDLKRIFEPFFRGATVLDSVGGTGLGLSIVKDCVNLHGGTISVSSEVNQGTTFLVRLPQSAS